MANGTVGVTQGDAPDRLIDNDVLTIGASNVYRQRIIIADPNDPSGLARVINTTPSATDYGQITREISTADLTGRFYRILNDVIPDGYEKRLDLGVTDQYLGYATDGASTSSGGNWTVMRIYLTAGSPTRIRTRTAVDWDSRTAGWT